jgi:DNA polymerase
MGASNHSLSRVARQHLETSRLFGVDFVPLREAPASPQPPLSPMASMDASGRAAALEELRARHDVTCPHCTCASYHKRTVFGEGNPCAELMFVGEAPGEEEDRTGRPFVGRAGQKLDEIIKAMGLAREQVYIANILKSRPPDNRTPLQHEIEACGPFLGEQIRIIRPAVLIALGGPAAKALLQTETGITRLRGQWGWYRDADLHIPIMPTFHPAYILRNYTLETRRKVWSDMQAVLQKLAELREKSASIA